MNLDKINSYIENKVEENLNLDYKASGSLQRNDKKTNEISKDVSAFANSDGGIIIYGIEEEDHVPKNFHFVDGNLITKEWLEQVIQTRIHRKIPGLKIIPIRFEKKIEKSIYVVKIPESIDAPHQTSDKRFYKRYNFESVQMEEYEIRALYNRYQTTQFELNDLIINKNIKTLKEDGNINLWIHATNIGRLYEDKYKLHIKCPEQIFVTKTKFLPGKAKKNLNLDIKYKGQIIELVSKSKEIVFPNEKYQFGFVEINVTDLKQLKGLMLELKLIHPGGIEERKYKLEELIQEDDLK